jgi:3-phenylpropionate/trans-cinnamate dioxygenase ferredoxin subunit
VHVYCIKNAGGFNILESSWKYVADENALEEDVMSVVFPGGLPVIIVKKEGKLYAVSNKCAHMGCTLSRGSLKDFTLKCPCHDWKFDIRSGEFLDAKEIRLPVYECKSIDGKIYINIQG